MDVTRITTEQMDNYHAHGASICPACGDDNLSGKSVTIDGNVAYQEVDCGLCGAGWRDVYTLNRVEDDQGGQAFRSGCWCPRCGRDDVSPVGEALADQARGPLSGVALTEFQCNDCHGASFWLEIEPQASADTRPPVPALEAEYVQELVDQSLPTCPKCHQGSVEARSAADDEVHRFPCQRCGTEFKAKAEVHTVWSTFEPAE